MLELKPSAAAALILSSSHHPLKIALQVAENVEEHKSVLKFFMHGFCCIIKSVDSTYKELSIAIRGYGFFAAVSLARWLGSRVNAAALRTIAHAVLEVRNALIFTL